MVLRQLSLHYKATDPAMEDADYDFESLLTTCLFNFYIAHLPRGYHIVQVCYKIGLCCHTTLISDKARQGGK